MVRTSFARGLKSFAPKIKNQIKIVHGKVRKVCTLNAKTLTHIVTAVGSALKIMFLLFKGNCTAKCTVWQTSRNVDIMNRPGCGVMRVFCEPASCRNNHYPCISVLLLVQLVFKFGEIDVYLQHLFQGSAMAAMGEWRDSLKSYSYCLIVLSISSAHISTYTEATQTLLTWELHQAILGKPM